MNPFLLSNKTGSEILCLWVGMKGNNTVLTEIYWAVIS
jgi:hypothetical protein